MKISLFNTYIDTKAYKSVRDVLTSSFISEGKVVKEFEGKLASYLGWVNPIAVNSGTSALHLAIIISGIGKGDEVILPAQTFIATAMVVVQVGAKPVFADIQYETGNIDPASIRKKITPKTKAIMVVDWGGYPCDLDELRKTAEEYDLMLIEDAAHAAGAIYKGSPIGSISPITCFSFQAIKHITTGDGGAVCCLDKKLAHQAFKLKWFGIDRDNDKPSILGERVYNLDTVGYKYHLNDYAASLGLANLNNLKKRLHRRRKIADKYRTELKKISGIKMFDYKKDRESSYWLFGMHVEKRADFIKALSSNGIMTSVVHQRIDRNKVFGGIRGDLINQNKFDETQIHIPLHEGLTGYQIGYIIQSIKRGW